MAQNFACRKCNASLLTIKSSAMKSALPFLTLIVALASCTTAYKSAQTPDDVYFSPARPHAEQNEYVQSDDRGDRYRYDEQSDDDRYLRMKVHNRRTWSNLDYYYSDPFAYNYYNPYNNYYSPYSSTPWNYYSSWNYYYNPYSYYSPYSTYYSYNPYFYNSYGSYGGSKVIIGNSRPPVYNHPRTFNLNVYNPPANNSMNNSSRRVYRGDNRNFNYNNSNNYNSNNNSGSSLRNIFSNSNSSNSSSTPSRSSVSTPSSSPSRSSSSSTNAPVRRF